MVIRVNCHELDHIHDSLSLDCLPQTASQLLRRVGSWKTRNHFLRPRSTVDSVVLVELCEYVCCSLRLPVCTCLRVMFTCSKLVTRTHYLLKQFAQLSPINHLKCKRITGPSNSSGECVFDSLAPHYLNTLRCYLIACHSQSCIP